MQWGFKRDFRIDISFSRNIYISRKDDSPSRHIHHNNRFSLFTHFHQTFYYLSHDIAESVRQYYSVFYERKYFSNFLYLCWLMTLLWLTWHHSVALINLSKLSRNIGNIFFSLQAGKRGPTGEVIKYYSLLSLLNLWSQDKLFAPLLLTILTIPSYPQLSATLQLYSGGSAQDWDETQAGEHWVQWLDLL